MTKITAKLTTQKQIKQQTAEKKAENAETPQTGDSAHVVMNILVMAICAAAIVTVICRKRHVR